MELKCLVHGAQAAVTSERTDDVIRQVAKANDDLSQAKDKLQVNKTNMFKQRHVFKAENTQLTNEISDSQVTLLSIKSYNFAPLLVVCFHIGHSSA